MIEVVLNLIFFYVIAFIAGIVFQTLLPRELRMFLIYPIVFSLAFASMRFSNYYLLAFALGMTSRAAIGGYWNCLFLEMLLLIAGIVLSFIIVV